MTAYAAILGMGLMALAGGLALLAALGVTFYLTGLMGQQVYKRLRAIYHWQTLAWWFKQVEKNGARVLQRADESDMAYTARMEARRAATTTSPTKEAP